MKVSLCTGLNNTNQNFGRALHCPDSNTIAEGIGRVFAEQLEIAKPQLIKLAQDVDLYIDLKKSKHSSCSGFHIIIAPLEPKRSFLKRFLGIDDRPYVHTDVYNYNLWGNKMSEVLVDRAEKLKETFH